MNSDRLTSTIEGVVREVTRKTSASGKEYAALLLNVTESRKTGDKVMTIPMTAWHDRRDKCLALCVGQTVTVAVKILAYESNAGWHNVTLYVTDLLVVGQMNGRGAEPVRDVAESDFEQIEEQLPF